MENIWWKNSYLEDRDDNLVESTSEKHKNIDSKNLDATREVMTNKLAASIIKFKNFYNDLTSEWIDQNEILDFIEEKIKQETKSLLWERYTEEKWDEIVKIFKKILESDSVTINFWNETQVWDYKTTKITTEPNSTTVESVHVVENLSVYRDRDLTINKSEVSSFFESGDNKALMSIYEGENFIATKIRGLSFRNMAMSVLRGHLAQLVTTDENIRYNDLASYTYRSWNELYLCVPVKK